MARILGGGLFGEMRGKLGSLVFARNRAGAYARGYAKPVDPATIAQLSARNAFGTASSNYHSLSDTNKALWANFATNVFNPKTGTQGVPSGFNAFVSLLTVINNIKPFKTYEYSGIAPLVGTPLPWMFGGTPPLHTLEANVKSGALGAYAYNFDSFSPILYSSDLTKTLISGTIDFSITGNIGISGTSSKTSDANGNDFGFKIFMSNSVAQEHMFIQNPYKIDIGTAPAIAITPSVDLFTGFSLDFGAELEPARYRDFPHASDWVQLTVFAVSRQGQMLRVGSQMKQLAGAL